MSEKRKRNEYTSTFYLLNEYCSSTVDALCRKRTNGTFKRYKKVCGSICALLTHKPAACINLPEKTAEPRRMLSATLNTVGTGVKSHFLNCRAMSSTEYVLKRSNLWNTSSFIGGKWITGSSNLGTFEVCNPATGQVIANCFRMTADDVVIAADISNEAWKSWRKTLAVDRAKVLRRMSELMKENSDDLAYIITKESGKPYSEAKGEINYARSFFDYYAEEATRIKGEMMENSFHGQKMITLKQSVGPAALITPWNFPSASKDLIQRHTVSTMTIIAAQCCICNA